jgi:ubiquinone/menaquinone biosynthesis C-methylase UbiE
MADVVSIFNEMEDDYDDLNDPWYSWLYSRLHYFIAKTVIKHHNPDTVLDIGCGTGFQSYLHAAAGSTVIGIDMANDLVAKATEKDQQFDYRTVELFPVYFDYVTKYNRIIKKIVDRSRGDRPYTPPTFHVGDATNLAFDNEYFDHCNCCGAVLNFIPQHQKAFCEIARVLKPNGTFFMEIDARWNFDAFWTVLDPFLRGRFGLNEDFQQGARLLRTHPLHNVIVDFPFGEKDKPVHMKMKYFTHHFLKRTFLSYGLRVEKRWSIHSLTNLIPSTILDTSFPSKKLVKLFTFLARLEECLPFFLPGSSLVYYGHKIKK